MNLVKEVWEKSDRAEFLQYLEGCAKPDKQEWTRKIINSKMPLLAIPTPTIRAISKEIAKGNFISFLRLGINDYYDSVSVNGMLITKIKEFDIMESFLIPYAEAAENWATCDLLSFVVNAQNKDKWWNLAVRLIANSKPLARRIGIDILFKFIELEGYIDGIFDILSGFGEEAEYYVNMVIAWLVAECFAKQREKTLSFFERGTLNTFTVNKAISKCRDSYRISASDKEMLLKFKRK